MKNEIDYKIEYEGLVNEIIRHFYPRGRMVEMQGFYSVANGDDFSPAIKLSESPYIYQALVRAGALESKDNLGYKILSIPQEPGGLKGIINEK